MTEPLTLMAVHAHPDDEAIGTGGVLAQAADSGIQTVLVTCTGGEVGEIASPTLASAENLAEVRERELRTACEILNVSHLELLGYRDSGMVGTADNDHPDAFAQANLEHAAARLVKLVRKYRPQVMVTYDENGFYGHPDHINAHRIAAQAYELAADATRDSGDGLAPWAPSKLYYTAVPRSAMADFGRRLREAGIEPPMPDGDGDTSAEERPWGTPDELITTVVDVSAQVERKRRGLFAHATQMGPEVFFARLPPALFDQLFSRETFILAKTRIEPTLLESDLFAGLR